MTKNQYSRQKRGRELEAKGTVNNLCCPDNSEVDLDFMVKCVGSGETIFIDHKRIIDFGNFLESMSCDGSK